MKKDGFAIRLRELIKREGLSITDFIQITELPNSTIHNWLYRNCIPREKYLNYLSCFFEVPVSYLLEGEKTKRNSTKKTGNKKSNTTKNEEYQEPDSNWISECNNNINYLYWTDQRGLTHKICDMDTAHIRNCIPFCNRTYNENLEEMKELSQKMKEIAWVLEHYPHFIRAFKKELELRERYGKK